MHRKGKISNPENLDDIYDTGYKYFVIFQYFNDMFSLFHATYICSHIGTYYATILVLVTYIRTIYVYITMWQRLFKDTIRFQNVSITDISLLLVLFISIHWYNAVIS